MFTNVSQPFKASMSTLTLLALLASSFSLSAFTALAADVVATNINTQETFASIQEAIDDAETVDGHTIVVGSHSLDSQVNVNKSVTLKGDAGAVISVSGAGNRFLITASGAVIRDFTITKTDKAGEQNIIGIQAADVSILNNNISGNYAIGDGDVSRAFVLSSNAIDVVIEGNTFSSLRQPAYINNNATGVIENNTVSGTRGFVAHADSEFNFIGNTFSGNTADIVIIGGSADNYTNVLGISQANNGAFVLNKYSSPNRQSEAYVSTSGVDGRDGGALEPLLTISEALSRVVSGGKVIVTDGSYTEDVILDKAVTLKGQNAVLTGKVLVTSSDVTIDSLTVTNPLYSGSSIQGIHIWSAGPVISNIQLLNNNIEDVKNANTKGSYGIMVQGHVSDVVVESNDISNIESAGWARGIEITPTCNDTSVVPQNILLKNNNVSNVISATGDAFALTIDAATCTNGQPNATATASEVTIDGNNFNGLDTRNLDTTSSIVEILPTPTPAPSTGGSSSGGSRARATTNVDVPQGQVLGATTIFQFNVDLGVGSTHSDVVELQKILIGKGLLNIPTPTGYYGPLTEAAVKVYQASKGIITTGFFGPLTRAALNAELNSGVNTSGLSETQLRTLLEAALNRLQELLGN